MEQTLTHWKKLNNPDYIGAYSLDRGKDMTLTIDYVNREIITGTGGKKEECTVLHFKEAQKPMILNRTNAKTIQKIYGTPYIEEWAGKKITLFASVTKLADEEVECLRIRPVRPTLPELLLSDTDNFRNCQQAIRNGYSIEQIQKKWTLSPEVIKELLK